MALVPPLPPLWFTPPDRGKVLVFIEIFRASDIVLRFTSPTHYLSSFSQSTVGNQTTYFPTEETETQKEAACSRHLPNRWGDWD